MLRRRTVPIMYDSNPIDRQSLCGPLDGTRNARREVRPSRQRSTVLANGFWTRIAPTWETHQLPVLGLCVALPVKSATGERSSVTGPFHANDALG